MCKYKLMIGKGQSSQGQEGSWTLPTEGSSYPLPPQHKHTTGTLGGNRDLFTSSSFSVGAFPSDLQRQGCASANPHTSFGGLAPGEPGAQ